MSRLICRIKSFKFDTCFLGCELPVNFFVNPLRAFSQASTSVFTLSIESILLAKHIIRSIMQKFCKLCKCANLHNRVTAAIIVISFVFASKRPNDVLHLIAGYPCNPL